MTSPIAIERAQTFLVLSIVVTVLLYVVPYGHTIGYPLVLLSTLAHEMGHGIAAILVGGTFDQFQMWTDGSGVAQWYGDVGRLGKAFVSAGGLVGPAVTAALGFWLARGEKSARVGLIVLGVGLVVAEVLVVRGAFGMVFVAALAAICFLLAYKVKPWIGQVTVGFIAVQLALSVFSRGDYLFTATAQTSKGPMPSDVAQMSDALWLPYWFWGAVCGLLSVAVMLLGLRAFFKKSAKA
ncbi:MAG: M50 family metallopeptidase [Myxococcales bacterium]|nr:M50 family metallopeptidase [Myxococcales bacterium]MCB9544626.1 M50 family metallopeptidase [Myxococcales bacterium]